MPRRLMPLWIALLGSTFAAAGSAEAACYTVYRSGGTAFRSVVVPVDLSKQLHETVPVVFGPGATMVIAQSADGCLPVDNRGRRDAGTPVSSTARALRRGAGASRGRSVSAEGYFERAARPMGSEIGVSNTADFYGSSSRVGGGAAGVRADRRQDVGGYLRPDGTAVQPYRRSVRQR